MEIWALSVQEREEEERRGKELTFTSTSTLSQLTHDVEGRLEDVFSHVPWKKRRQNTDIGLTPAANVAYLHYGKTPP